MIISNLEPILDIHELKISKLKHDVEELKPNEQDFKSKMDNLEHFSRKNNLRFYGVPEKANGNTTTLIMETLQKQHETPRGGLLN